MCDFFQTSSKTWTLFCKRPMDSNFSLNNALIRNFWVVTIRWKLSLANMLWVVATARAIYTRRVARQYGICWLKEELSMVHGTLHTYFRNKTFLFVKIESWNFQQLFDLGFHETLQNFNSFKQTFRRHFCMANKELSE